MYANLMNDLKMIFYVKLMSGRGHPDLQGK